MKLHERLLLLLVLIVGISDFGTHAQNINLTPSVLTMASTAVAANCPAPAASTTTYCLAADKAQVSTGGAYVVIWPGPAIVAQQLTLNGVTKTLPASFTIAAAAPTISAPTVSAPTASAPSSTAPVVTAQ